MKIDNPFESGHIKNYVLLYVSVVVIMILFFIATNLFHDVDEIEKKAFDTNITKIAHVKKIMKNVQEVNSSAFRLIDTGY